MKTMTQGYIGKDPDGNYIITSTSRGDATPDEEDVFAEYLAEGGANIVYYILGDGPRPYSGRLLRARKDKPFIQSTMKQYEAFHKHFATLFPSENLIELIPVRLDPEFIAALNYDLENTFSGRLKQWDKDRVAEDEAMGMFITNMTAGPDEYVVDAKPKWLAQSPNAPADAVRCRTCALRAQRRVENTKKHAGSADFCPLALVADDEQTRERAATALVELQGQSLPSGAGECKLPARISCISVFILSCIPAVTVFIHCDTAASLKIPGAPCKLCD